MALADYEPIDDFGDAAAEARACRSDCALFDFSFLECARLEGIGARGVVEAFTGRSLAALDVGRIYYALRVGQAGDVVADLTVWRLGADCYEVMSGRRKDVEDLLGHAGPGVHVADMTPKAATFSLQGPGSLDALRRLGDFERDRAPRVFQLLPSKAEWNHMPDRTPRLHRRSRIRNHPPPRECTPSLAGHFGTSAARRIYRRRHAPDRGRLCSVQERIPLAGFTRRSGTRKIPRICRFAVPENRADIVPGRCGHRATTLAAVARFNAAGRARGNRGDLGL